MHDLDRKTHRPPTDGYGQAIADAARVVTERNAELNALFVAAHSENEKLRRHIRSLQQNLDRRALDVDQAARGFQQSLAERDASATTEVADLRRRLTDAERDALGLQEQLERTTAERDALARSDVAQTVAELMQMLRAADAKLAERTKERDDERRVVADLMADIDETNAILAQTVAERDEARRMADESRAVSRQIVEERDYRIATLVAERDEKIRAAEERALRAERDLEAEVALSVARLERWDRCVEELDGARRVVQRLEAELAESSAAVRGLAKEGLDVRAERERLAADGERLAGLIERYAVALCVCGKRYTAAEYDALELLGDGSCESRRCLCGASVCAYLRTVTQ